MTGHERMRLSPTQAKAMEIAREGGRLVRLRGGFWTGPQVPTRASEYMGCSVPEWYCSVTTVRALERMGLLVRCGELVDEWRDPRRPKEVAR